MDEKFYKRYESYRKSLAALAEVRNRDLNDSFVMSGAGAKFSITFYLAWKVMKDIIIQDYAVVDFPKGSPREVLRKAFDFSSSAVRYGWRCFGTEMNSHMTMMAKLSKKSATK